MARSCTAHTNGEDCQRLPLSAVVAVLGGAMHAARADFVKVDWRTRLEVTGRIDARTANGHHPKLLCYETNAWAASDTYTPAWRCVTRLGGKGAIVCVSLDMAMR